ncbi:MAG TPA: NAD(P)H-dependent oxidoreductase [Nitrososphaeraceae archaeon]|jgi:azobenzene reductase|nr:NAD(P)H-dependent oxidoreductase [Nitrososphaeraceae archaeon]
MEIDDSLINLINQKITGFKLLGIGSSLRKNSSSNKLLKMVLDKSQRYGANTSIIELSKINFPIFNPNKPNEISEDIKKINEQIINADAFILATPDYHGSMSGGMKNFLDYYWYEFSGKIFGYIVSSHEKGLTVMDHMRTAIRQCYGWSLPYGLSINTEYDLDEHSNVNNPKLLQRMENMSRDIVTYGKLLRMQFIHDTNNKEQTTFAFQFKNNI